MSDDDSGDNASNEDSTLRDEFLLRMYDQLWESLDRVEGGMWSFIAAYAAIAVSVILGLGDSVDLFYAVIFTTIISLWGMNISVVSWRWHRRNLVQISNLEQEILTDEDIGNIIPEDYIDRHGLKQGIPFHSISSINFLAFFSAFIISIYSFLLITGSNLTFHRFVTLYLISTLGIGYTLINYFKTYKKVNKFSNETKNTDPQDPPFSTQVIWNFFPILILIFLTIALFFNRDVTYGPFLVEYYYIIPGVVFAIQFIWLSRVRSVQCPWERHT